MRVFVNVETGEDCVAAASDTYGAVVLIRLVNSVDKKAYICAEEGRAFAPFGVKRSYSELPAI